MNVGLALRTLVRRPLSSFRHHLFNPVPLHGIASPSPATSFRAVLTSNFPRSTLFGGIQSFSTSGASFTGLTDSRFPKRRPGLKKRKKRASLRPRGPYAWVQYVPGEPIPSSRPNEGSVQGRNHRKRVKQKKAFILAEKKKCRAQYAEARKKRDMERIERKMAAVAREKAWAERLKELQQMEEAKKASMG